MHRRIVEAVTRALTAELHLPGFEEWRAAYQASPEQVDDELLLASTFSRLVRASITTGT